MRRRGLSLLLVQSFNRRFRPSSSSRFRGDNLSLLSCTSSRVSICSHIGFLVRSWWRSLFPCSNMVDEATVGIACFANNAPGFRGILKERYVYIVFKMKVFFSHRTNCMYIHPYVYPYTYIHPYLPTYTYIPTHLLLPTIYTCPHT